MAGVDARLDEHAAADGTALFDLVVNENSAEHVIYRGIDRAHVERVRRALVDGSIDVYAVQRVLTEVVLRRGGAPRSMFVRGMPIPLPGTSGTPKDRWTEARAQMEALLEGH
jgi:hypothetical protein